MNGTITVQSGGGEPPPRYWRIPTGGTLNAPLKCPRFFHSTQRSQRTQRKHF
jgi:hypothetical protein